MISSLVEAAGLVCLVVGVFLVFGAGWALIVGGVLLVLAGFAFSREV